MASANILYMLCWFWLILVHCNHSSSNNITCSNNASCHINCNNNTCSSKTIQCPMNNQYECNILCPDQNSCKNTTINAAKSSKLHINCNEFHSCSYMNIYCPSSQSSQSEKQCVIQTNNNNNTNINIFAINGWDDIEITNHSSQSIIFSGNLHCKPTYNSAECPFNLINSPYCNPSDHECNSIQTPMNSTSVPVVTTQTTGSTSNPTLIASLSITTEIGVESNNIWDELSKIHILWWIIMLLVLAFCCLISILLCYMRIQHNYAKKLLEAHRMSQVVTERQNSEYITGADGRQMRKLKSFSCEASQSQTNVVALRPSSVSTKVLSIEPTSSTMDGTATFNKQQSAPQHVLKHKPKSKSMNQQNITTQFNKRSKSVGHHVIDIDTFEHHPNVNSIQMQVNPAYHSHAKTLAFKPRKDVVPIQSNTDKENTNTNSPISPQYEVEDSNEETDIVSIEEANTSKTSSNKSHQTHPAQPSYPQRNMNMNMNNNMYAVNRSNSRDLASFQNTGNPSVPVPINKFYTQRSDNSASSTARIMYQQQQQQQQQQQPPPATSPRMYNNNNIPRQQSYGSSVNGGGSVNNGYIQNNGGIVAPNSNTQIVYGQYSQSTSNNVGNGGSLNGSSKGISFNQFNPVPPPSQQQQQQHQQYPHNQHLQTIQRQPLQRIESQKQQEPHLIAVRSEPESIQNHPVPPPTINSQQSYDIAPSVDSYGHEKEEKASELNSDRNHQIDYNSIPPQQPQQPQQPPQQQQGRVHSPSIERNNMNLQYAMQYLAGNKNENINNRGHHTEEPSAAWTETNMSQLRLGQSVPNLDNEPSSGIDDMLGGMFGMKMQNDDDSILDDQDEDEDEEETQTTEMNVDTVYETYLQ